MTLPTERNVGRSDINGVVRDYVRRPAKAVLRRWGMATADSRRWPDFLLVGTKRGGTTSLFNYLLAHPAMVPMFPARGMKSPHYFYREFRRGPEWYRSHFATDKQRQALEAKLGGPTVTGEASPYYLYHPYTAARVHQLVPHVKIVMSLRDPVRRAYSHYWERFDQGVETLSFEDALAAEPQRLAGELERMAKDPLYYSRPHDWYSYRDRGIYAPQVQRWLALFPRDQILVLRAEDFYADEQATFDQLTDFLGVARHRLPDKPRLNYRPAEKMRSETAAELAEFYRPHNAALETLLGRTFGWTG
jgi:sulfotransferase family protein